MEKHKTFKKSFFTRMIFIFTNNKLPIYKGVKIKPEKEFFI